MDNASRALVMAGGVMIAIAVISVAIYFYSTASGYASQSQQALSASQIQSFNRFYTAYNSLNGEIRVVDALNILNRAVEDEVTESYSGSYIKRVDSKQTHHYEPNNEVSYLSKAYFKLTYDVEGKVSAVAISDSPF